MKKKKKQKYICTQRERVLVIKMSSYVLHFPYHTMSTSQPACSGNPPIFLGTSLGLLCLLWVQFRLISDLTLDCICFQNPQLSPHSPQSQANYGALICCICRCRSKFLSFSLAPDVQFWFLPHLCRLLSGVCSHPNKRGQAWWLIRAH